MKTNNCIPGMQVELVSKASTYSLHTDDFHNLGITLDMLRLRKLTKIHPGDIGIIRAINGECVEIEWECGIKTCVIPLIDNIREVTVPVRVYRPHNNLLMEDWELADWANTVHKCAGGNGAAFTANIMYDRLKGHHCSCGVNELGYTNGVFKLLHFISNEVRTGGKAYMVCQKCGCMSHL